MAELGELYGVVWHDIAEALPKEGVSVFVYAKDGNGGVFCRGYWKREKVLGIFHRKTWHLSCGYERKLRVQRWANELERAIETR